ncbi:hypothetical protein F4775DRAFT_550044 [Biscogniauxia sp. FL1348]|nr:hypothetical protein F4775DRAFT_550044 [Biscogniauxia sp. FL1348]
MLGKRPQRTYLINGRVGWCVLVHTYLGSVCVGRTSTRPKLNTYMACFFLDGNHVPFFFFFFFFFLFLSRFFFLRRGAYTYLKPRAWSELDATVLKLRDLPPLSSFDLSVISP